MKIKWFFLLTLTPVRHLPARERGRWRGVFEFKTCLNAEETTFIDYVLFQFYHRNVNTNSFINGAE